MTRRRRLSSETVVLHSIDANITLHINLAFGSLTSAVLRAAALLDPPVSVSAGPSSAFNSNSSNNTASFCGNALSLTVRRLNHSADADITSDRSIAPCTNASNATLASQMPHPSVHFNASLLRAAARLHINGALDASIVQVSSRYGGHARYTSALWG